MTVSDARRGTQCGADRLRRVPGRNNGLRAGWRTVRDLKDAVREGLCRAGCAARGPRVTAAKSRTPSEWPRIPRAEAASADSTWRTCFCSNAGVALRPGLACMTRMSLRRRALRQHGHRAEDQQCQDPKHTLALQAFPSPVAPLQTARETISHRRRERSRHLKPNPLSVKAY